MPISKSVDLKKNPNVDDATFKNFLSFTSHVCTCKESKWDPFQTTHSHHTSSSGKRNGNSSPPAADDVLFQQISDILLPMYLIHIFIHIQYLHFEGLAVC